MRIVKQTQIQSGAILPIKVISSEKREGDDGKTFYTVIAKIPTSSGTTEMRYTAYCDLSPYVKQAIFVLLNLSASTSLARNGKTYANPKQTIKSVIAEGKEASRYYDLLKTCLKETYGEDK